MRTVSAFVVIIACATFACSGKKAGEDLTSATPATSPAPGPAESAAAAPAPAASGTSGGDGDPGAPKGDGDAAAPPVDATSTSTCAVLASGPRAPSITPDACMSCVAGACCVSMTTCYGGDAASGVAGADGVQTACMLAGACLEQCDESDGGPVCEAQCEVVYGSQPLADWDATQQCMLQSCAAFCP
jgi:hypothetical protein